MKKCQVRDISIHYIEIGEGKPILFIHGWSPDHRMMRGCFEPIFSEKKGYRRIYLDLPGMGQTPVKSWIQNSDDILEILCEFIHHVIRNKTSSDLHLLLIDIITSESINIIPNYPVYNCNHSKKSFFVIPEFIFE